MLRFFSDRFATWTGVSAFFVPLYGSGDDAWFASATLPMALQCPVFRHGYPSLWPSVPLCGLFKVNIPIRILYRPFALPLPVPIGIQLPRAGKHKLDLGPIPCLFQLSDASFCGPFIGKLESEHIVIHSSPRPYPVP